MNDTMETGAREGRPNVAEHSSAPIAGEADLIVVGGGGAGLSAAIEAASLGANTMLFEKAASLGGSTAWSVGSFSATRTPHQIRRKIVDNPEDHFEDLGKFAGNNASRDNLTLRRLLVENAPETFQWLLQLGVVFHGPMPEPPHRQPRMHNVLPNSRAFIDRLAKRARSIGVTISCSEEVVGLERVGDRIESVIVRGAAGARRVKTKAGIVLATGDFSGSREMKRQYLSSEAAATDAVNRLNTGDGHKIALALGARILNSDLAHGPELRFVPPKRGTLVSMFPTHPLVGHLCNLMMEHAPAAILRPFLMSFLVTTLAPAKNLFNAGALVVNKNGERVDPQSGGLTNAVSTQPEGIGFIVFDERIARLFDEWPNFISTAPGVAYAYLSDYRRSRRDIFYSAATLNELAQNLKIDSEKLTHSAIRLSEPPFFALGPLKSYMIFTDGGLAVNERLQVLNQEDKPIPGLYAAGATGQGGLLLEGHGHHLAWAFTSGRLAARSALRERQK